jgi:hypothetical protein
VARTEGKQKLRRQRGLATTGPETPRKRRACGRPESMRRDEPGDAKEEMSPVASLGGPVATGPETPKRRRALSPARENGLRRAGGRQGCEEPCVQPE